MRARGIGNGQAEIYMEWTGTSGSYKVTDKQIDGWQDTETPYTEQMRYEYGTYNLGRHMQVAVAAPC